MWIYGTVQRLKTDTSTNAVPSAERLAPKQKSFSVTNRFSKILFHMKYLQTRRFSINVSRPYSTVWSTQFTFKMQENGCMCYSKLFVLTFLNGRNGYKIFDNSKRLYTSSRRRLRIYWWLPQWLASEWSSQSSYFGNFCCKFCHTLSKMFISLYSILK